VRADTGRKETSSVPTNSTTTLARHERTELQQREAVIERGRRSFYEMGEALRAIRDSRLYRETHERFEDYVEERWEISRSAADRLIQAFSVVKSLPALGEGVPAPANEAQAAALASIPESTLPDLWQRVTDRARELGTAITAKLVKRVVEEHEAALKAAVQAAQTTQVGSSDTVDHTETPATPEQAETGEKLDPQVSEPENVITATPGEGAFSTPGQQAVLTHIEETEPDPEGEVIGVAQAYVEPVSETWTPPPTPAFVGAAGEVTRAAKLVVNELTHRGTLTRCDEWILATLSHALDLQAQRVAEEERVAREEEAAAQAEEARLDAEWAKTQNGLAKNRRTKRPR
jgi:hypothetical protein